MNNPKAQKYKKIAEAGTPATYHKVHIIKTEYFNALIITYKFYEFFLILLYLNFRTLLYCIY